MQAVIFGWKRDHYKKNLIDCETIAEQLTKKKFNIYTGGGGGFMLAGNKGCYKVDPTKSHAISVKCLYEKEGRNNTYYDKKNLIVTDTFAERKYLLFKDMDLYIFFPGGMGTIEEFSELITLFKTGELPIKPIILYNLTYWSTLNSWFKFNKLNWPESYITCIVNSVNEFNKFYKDEFKSKKKDENDRNFDIKNYKSINDKSNIFNDNLIDNLINEVFKDPNLKNLNNLLDDDLENDNISSDEIFIEVIIIDDNIEMLDNNSIELSYDENYDDINLSESESNSESEVDSDDENYDDINLSESESTSDSEDN